MGSLLVGLIPVALGIILSPLAIVAVIVVLVSPRARTNSIAFLVGWLAGIVVGVFGTYAVLLALDVDPPSGEPPGWVGWLHAVLAVVLLGSAWLIYRHQYASVKKVAAADSPKTVAAAVPTLPGWLQNIESFTPPRTAALAFGLMLLNPVDLSCAIGAGIEFARTPVSTTSAVVAGILFVLVAGSSVIAPVVILFVKGHAADPILQSMRTWIAGHNGLVNALLLVVIGALQVVKAVQAL